jgi:hypothetical protein
MERCIQPGGGRGANGERTGGVRLGAVLVGAGFARCRPTAVHARDMARWIGGEMGVATGQWASVAQGGFDASGSGRVGDGFGP